MGSHVETPVRPISVLERAGHHVKLTLPARPENVAVIRHLLGAYAAALRLPRQLVEDLRLAATEACTNVVRHAYHADDPGPVEISIRPQAGGVRLVVVDRGRGIGSSGDADGPGLGLPLISAIADEVTLEAVPGGGSRVAMTFSTRGSAA